MALAVNIEVSFTQKKVISARSWNENPMGATLTIDAPLPPIPQEPIPLQEGRCPRNPMWTTRFPNGNEKWWPVNFTNKDPRGPTWSAFTNRFAISPIPPLSTPGSDSGGIVYRNSWNIDFPYDGFYALKATVDNGGRILIDDREIIRGGGVSFETGTGGVLGIEGFSVENPKATKFFLTKGLHKIEVEVENQKTETFTKINKKVFSTKDWLFKSTGFQSSGLVDVTFDVYGEGRNSNTFIAAFTSEDGKDSFILKGAQKSRENRKQIIKVKPNIKYKVSISSSIGNVEQGTIVDGTKNKEGGLRESNKIFGDRIGSDNDNDDMQVTTSIGTFTPSNKRDAKGSGRSTYDIIFSVGTQGRFEVTKQSPTAAGVVYEGPTAIANYVRDFISPTFQDVNIIPNEEIQGKTWIFRWSNVDFPVNGQYTLEAEADDNLIIKVDGVQVGRAKVSEGRGKTKFNATAGKKTVELELSNIRIPNTGFSQNPVAGFAEITIPVDAATGLSKPWTQNPIGISAILIPPPCPRVIKGKGVVTRVDVDDPGNSFPPPAGPGYPVALRLKSVNVLDPGINHNCGVDKIEITPSNGAVLDYDCDSFGRIRSVKVLNPGLGFVGYPDIRMVTDTGINATFAPQFEVVRDPIVIDSQKLIQVTDLAGLKQTGYVDGRAYYGAVFLKDGLLFAGFYETPGELVQVYSTLRESIDAQVTTRPSAIQRQGTDITSNDPRLNIPGTPDQII